MYAKVFSQIFDSSIANDYQLRHFFTDLLVLAELDGVVDMTPEAISARTRIPLEPVLKFLDELSKPDPRSRSHAMEGRRIIPIDPHRDWGWQIVNYAEYRRLASDEQRRTMTAQRVRRHRQAGQPEFVSTLQHAQSEAVAGNVTLCNAPVTHGNACNAKQKQKQKQKQKHSTTPTPSSVGVTNGYSKGSPNGELFLEKLEELPEKLRSPRVVETWDQWMKARRGMKKPKSWEALFNAQISWLTAFEEPIVYEILSASLRNGWQGLFEPKYETRTRVSSQRGEENPRNIGICRAGPDYGELARRRQLREQDANGKPPMAGAVG